EREFRKRLKETETGGPVSVLEAILTSEGREKFERARQLACRKRNRVLDEGETVEVLSDHYLDSFDPDRKVPRKRRMPETNGRAGRNVPAEVKREVLGRTGDRCANPECDNEIFVDLAHDRPHARGGSREADNLDPLCGGCHLLKDRGLLIVRRTPEGLEFRTLDGRLIGVVEARSPPE
ncbi:MAG: HNH endonuclease, partial [Planctomycetota bacterium]